MHIGLNAHLLAGGASYRSAGIHGYIAQLLAHLPAAAPDWRFTAFVGASNAMQFDGVEMHRARLNTEAPSRRILWEQLAQPPQLYGLDLYHALAFVAPLFLLAPTVVTVYDLSFIHYPARLPASRRLYLRLLTGLTCRRARRVLAISESTARDVAETLHIPREKIDLAPPGCDAATFHPLPNSDVEAFRTARNLPSRFWLFVGTLEPRKNLVTLLQAYAALPTSSRLPLVIGGGKGWDYDDIFTAVEQHQLKQWVTFTGYIPPQDLPFWYNCAEVFLYPSVFEGFGLPILEAMACGTPVVVSDASSFPEIVGEAGLRVPPHDVALWTTALIRTSEDAGWRETAREQGLIEAARYTWQKTARETVASYRRALLMMF